MKKLFVFFLLSFTIQSTMIGQNDTLSRTFNTRYHNSPVVREYVPGRSINPVIKYPPFTIKPWLSSILNFGKKEFNFKPVNTVPTIGTGLRFLTTSPNMNVEEARITNTRRGNEGVTSAEKLEYEQGFQICVEETVRDNTFNSSYHMLNNNARYYLGAVVNGEKLGQGIYEFIPGNRLPVTFSIDIPNINGGPVKVMNNPSRSEYAQAVQELTRQGITGTPPTKMFYEQHRVYTKAQLDMKLDGYFNGLVHDITADFNLDWTNEKTKYLVKFSQVFFTLTTDDMDSDDFYTDKETGSNDLYVSSIAYGRTLLFLIESEKSETELDAAIDYAYDGIVNDGGIEVSTEYKNILDRSTMKVYVQGGNGETAIHPVTNGFEGIKDFITSGAEFHPTENPGSPLIYSLRFCENGHDAYAFTSTTYKKSICKPLDRQVKVGDFYIYNIAKKDEKFQGPKRMEPYGKIMVTAVIVDNNGANQPSWVTGIPQNGSVIYNKSSDQKISVAIGATKYVEGGRSFAFSHLDQINLDYSYIKVESKLKDWDKNVINGKDDDLFNTKKIYLKDFINTTNKGFTMEISGWRMLLGFNIERENLNSPYASNN